MRFNRLLVLFLALAAACPAAGQDTHYTLHDYAPLWLNPANTGSFSGTIRVGGIYRGQWYGLDGINSPTAYVDATLPFGIRKQDWIGVGLSLVNDKANFGLLEEGNNTSPGVDITQNFFGFSAAYHLALDKKRQNIVTLGAQYGSTSYQGDFGGVLAQEGNIQGAPGFQDEAFNEFMATVNSMNPNSGGSNNDFNDINAGVKVKLLLDPKKENVFEAGVSMYHLTSPERRTIIMEEDADTTMTPPPTMPGPRGRELRDRKATIHAHARLDMEMNDKWRFQPTAFFQQSAATSSLTVQTWGQRNLKKDLDLRLGLGYRTGDALQVLAGLNFSNFRAALSYDVTVSQARAVTNYQGAFEVSAAYIFNVYKKPDVTPTILCPDI